MVWFVCIGFGAGGPAPGGQGHQQGLGASSSRRSRGGVLQRLAKICRTWCWQVWGVAKDLFEGAEAAAAELQPNAVETCRQRVPQALTRLSCSFPDSSGNACKVLKSTRGAAQAVITQYAPCLNCA